MEVVNNIIRKI